VCAFELRTAEQRLTLSCRSASELDTWMLKLCAVTTQISLENEFLDQAEAIITGATYHRAHLEEQALIRKLSHASAHLARTEQPTEALASSAVRCSPSSGSATSASVRTLHTELAGSVDLTPYRSRSASLIPPPRSTVSTPAGDAPSPLTSVSRAQCEEIARAASSTQAASVQT
jgi:hypothetical protein